MRMKDSLREMLLTDVKAHGKDAHHAEYLLAVSYALDKEGNGNKDTYAYCVLTTTVVVKPWKGLRRLAGVGGAAWDPDVFTTVEGWVRSYAARQAKGTLSGRPAINVESDEEDAPRMTVKRAQPCKTPVKPHKQAAHTAPPPRHESPDPALLRQEVRTALRDRCVHCAFSWSCLSFWSYFLELWLGRDATAATAVNAD